VPRRANRGRWQRRWRNKQVLALLRGSVHNMLGNLMRMIANQRGGTAFNGGITMPNGKEVSKKEWSLFMEKVSEANKVLGSLIFIPVILIVGMAYGLRAGIIAGSDKALQMFREWGE